MTSKLEIAIIYAPQNGPPYKMYENDQGILYGYSTPQPDKVNVGMGFYSIPNPTNKDSILVLEPYCVLERDYDFEYVGMYKNIFTWTARAFPPEKFAGKIVEINHPSCHTLLDPQKMRDTWLPWNERKNEIVFIANNKASTHESELYSFRLELADLLSQRSKYEVSWYGEIPIDRSYYKGKIESKHEILSKVKFSVCTENSYDPIYTHNYFTEKMPEVWFAGAVPIYMGCYNINDFQFAEHSYIDLRIYSKYKRSGAPKLDMDALLSRIEGFDEKRYENFKDDVMYNIKKPNGLYHLISYNRMYDKIIKTLCAQQG